MSTVFDQNRGINMGYISEPTEAEFAALYRLLKIAGGNTGQCRHVASFLLAWANSGGFGAWNPVDLWSVDEEIARDELAVLGMIARSRGYPDNYGLRDEIQAIARKWRPEVCAKFKDQDA